MLKIHKITSTSAESLFSLRVQGEDDVSPGVGGDREEGGKGTALYTETTYRFSQPTEYLA
jgi:hypothetical protein